MALFHLSGTMPFSIMATLLCRASRRLAYSIAQYGPRSNDNN